MSADAEPRLTIGELAAAAGMTVRNVRNHQARGLLAPPVLVARTGYYGAEHLERLKLILDMLGKGYPLSAIRELLEAWEDKRSLADVLGFEQAVSAPFVTEEPKSYTAAEIVAMYPDEQQPERSWKRALELELVVPKEGEVDVFVAPSPLLLEAGAELVADGVPVAAVLDVAAAVRKATAKMADTFVSMFVRHVWEPFVAEGMPAERLQDITEALERQRPLAEQAVMAAMAQAMQKRVEAVVKEEAPELGRGKAKRRRRR